MQKQELNYKEIYELLDSRTSQILKTFDDFKAKEFEPLRAKVEKMWLYVTVAVGVTVVLFEIGLKELASKVIGQK